MAFFWTLVATVVVLGLCWRFLGAYMVAVYEGRAKWLTWVERPIYRALRVDSQAEQTWPRYATSVIVFSGVALLITYGIFRLQGYLPFNPNHFPAVRADTAWNTAVSFVTNTNWQSYSGETTMSYLSQMGALAVQNFLSAAVGMSVAVALIRGFARKGSKTIGNFWVDLVRSTVYIPLPIAFVAAIVFVFQGAVQTLSGAVHVHNALDGVDQILQRGPIASQEVIKQLGTNGGGFFNANGAGPFENPTGVTNLLSILLILCIPVAFTYVFGKMVFSIRQGVAGLLVGGIPELPYTHAFDDRAARDPRYVEARKRVDVVVLEGESVRGFADQTVIVRLRDGRVITKVVPSLEAQRHNLDERIAMFKNTAKSLGERADRLVDVVMNLEHHTVPDVAALAR